jgi:hypothetical protein
MGACEANMHYFDGTYNHEKYHCCKLEDAKVVLITEEGTGHCYVYPFADEKVGRQIASTFMVCWVLWDTELNILGEGGIGIAHNTIKQNGVLFLQKFKNQFEKV